MLSNKKVVMLSKEVIKVSEDRFKDPKFKNYRFVFKSVLVSTHCYLKYVYNTRSGTSILESVWSSVRLEQDIYQA